SSFIPFQTEQIKRANRLYTNDSIFLKKTLYIPVPVDPKGLANGLDLDEEEEEEEADKEEAGNGQPDNTKRPKAQRNNGASSSSAPKHDLSAADFLFKLDSEIRRSKQVATKKLREGEAAAPENEPGSVPATSSYQNELSPRAQQRAVLGPVPLTKIARADTLRDQEDEIFKL
ncbi:lysM and putative peptidoglycan-binding domain-containing protein 1, partial [Sphaerodactylus townsendi]|uniref:lysM and putative peptidoglycan-binding domain-containing protein 1 n=1 Tax=Sphaerodactylus townsendi TaxID=933632 RepID=UPI002026DD24